MEMLVILIIAWALTGAFFGASTEVASRWSAATARWDAAMAPGVRGTRWGRRGATLWRASRVLGRGGRRGMRVLGAVIAAAGRGGRDAVRGGLGRWRERVELTGRPRWSDWAAIFRAPSTPTGPASTPVDPDPSPDPAPGGNATVIEGVAWDTPAAPTTSATIITTTAPEEPMTGTDLNRADDGIEITHDMAKAAANRVRQLAIEYRGQIAVAVKVLETLGIALSGIHMDTELIADVYEAQAAAKSTIAYADLLDGLVTEVTRKLAKEDDVAGVLAGRATAKTTGYYGAAV